VLWPLAPRGHAPLRSLAEGSLFAYCGSSVAARHRGAEEEFLERFFLLLAKLLGAYVASFCVVRLIACASFPLIKSRPKTCSAKKLLCALQSTRKFSI
jgi:hypothetical protein